MGGRYVTELEPERVTSVEEAKETDGSRSCGRSALLGVLISSSRFLLNYINVEPRASWFQRVRQDARERLFVLIFACVTAAALFSVCVRRSTCGSFSSAGRRKSSSSLPTTRRQTSPSTSTTTGPWVSSRSQTHNSHCSW